MRTVRRMHPFAPGFLAVLIAAAAPAAPDAGSWPTPVPGHAPVKPGEHPRLFFRKTDLPALRARAQTPEGRAILERCRHLLDGADRVREPGAFTLWDGAAFGFLYQITGDKRYAELARRSIEQVWAGAVDRDNRYSLVPPNEPMRAGPSLSAVAMAYDLCYDAWDPAFRRQQVGAMLGWKGNSKKRGGMVSLERMALSPDNPNPISNHYALQVGGAGLTILAIRGDEGADEALLQQYQQGVDKAARKVLTEDFGEGGYFGEHAGPGVIASTWTFIPWLQAERVAAGRDWISSRPNAEWISLRFVMQTFTTPAGPMYLNPAPGRGGYGGDFLEQNGGHHATYFSNGFGAIQPHRKPAMLWVYEHFVRPHEERLYGSGAPKPELPAGQRSFDVFNYPHRAMFAFVNWPLGVQPENPDRTIPRVMEDRRMGQYVFRNRWQDGDDIAVALLFGSRVGDRLRRSMVWGLGRQMTFGSVAAVVEGNAKINRARIDAFVAAEDGSGAVSAGGQAVGVDYSRASGADAVVVMVGKCATGAITGADPVKAKVTAVTAGGVNYSILTLAASGTHPEAVPAADHVKLGSQEIRFDGTRIQFARMAGPLKIRP